MRTFAVLTCAVLAGSSFAGAAEIRGQYLEARTCDVYTGPCFANAEMSLGGKEAVMAWKVDDGGWQGTSLEGLSVALVIKAEDTLGDDGVFTQDPGRIESVILVDDTATSEQEFALVDFVKTSAADYTKNVKAVERTAITFENDYATMEGRLKAGRLAEIRTRQLQDFDCVCTNEQVFYQPLTDVRHSMPAYTVTQSFGGRGLDAKWEYHNSRSAFLAVFRR
ncbi:MAG: DUF1326 domain-containing protein [Maioricimonas sp. JB049]